MGVVWSVAKLVSNIIIFNWLIILNNHNNIIIFNSCLDFFFLQILLTTRKNFGVKKGSVT